RVSRMEEILKTQDEETSLLHGSADFLSHHIAETEDRGYALSRNISLTGLASASSSWQHLLVVLRGGLGFWTEYRCSLAQLGLEKVRCGLWSTSEETYRALVNALVLAWEINDDVLMATLLKYELPEILNEWR